MQDFGSRLGSECWRALFARGRLVLKLVVFDESTRRLLAEPKSPPQMQNPQSKHLDFEDTTLSNKDSRLARVMRNHRADLYKHLSAPLSVFTFALSTRLRGSGSTAIGRLTRMTFGRPEQHGRANVYSKAGRSQADLL